VSGATGRVAAARPRTGEVLLADAALQSVELDVDRGRARLRCREAELEFEGVRATTLLGPWDGAPGIVEHARVVASEPQGICVEIRVKYSTVPRVYRVVCTAVRRRVPARARRWPGAQFIRPASDLR